MTRLALFSITGTGGFILKLSPSLQEQQIVDWCTARLARFCVPEQVELRNGLPRTSICKVQKHLLRAQAG